MDHTRIRFKLRGKYWTLKLDNDECYGECDWSGREISINPNQSEEELLDTTIHELLHATNPRMSEHQVHTTANRISSILWRMGWRVN